VKAFFGERRHAITGDENAIAFRGSPANAAA
jgi:hypothetical protein